MNINNSPKQNCLNFFRYKLEINNKTQPSLTETSNETKVFYECLCFIIYL